MFTGETCQIKMYKWCHLVIRWLCSTQIIYTVSQMVISPLESVVWDQRCVECLYHIIEHARAREIVSCQRTFWPMMEHGTSWFQFQYTHHCATPNGIKEHREGAENKKYNKTLLNKRFVVYFIKHQLHLWKWLHKIHNILNNVLSSEIKRIVDGHSKQTTNILKDSIIIMIIIYKMIRHFTSIT